MKIHQKFCFLSLCLVLLVLSSAKAQFYQQGGKLVGTGNVGPAYQGISVSLSADGNTAIVSGSSDNSRAGTAWIWTRSGGIWTQQAKLVGTGNVGPAQQGISVSLSADGNTAIVGGTDDNTSVGAAWIFVRNVSTVSTFWSQQGNKLVGTGAVGASLQGSSVSLSSDGNTAIVGGRGDNNDTGAVWVYTRSAGVWSQQGSKLVGTGNVGPAEQGFSVSLSGDGNTAIVGGPGDNNTAGAAWTITRNGGVWSQLGSKLVGTGAAGYAQQGTSVSISGDGGSIIVGGYNDSTSLGSGVGASWVYYRDIFAGGWAQQGGKLVGFGAVGGAEQGYSVSLSYDGNTAIVGGPYDNFSEAFLTAAGAAWVFTRSIVGGLGVWSQQGSKLVGTGAVGYAQQGTSVSISGDGNTAVVGGYRDNSYVGAVWAYYIPGSPVIASIRDIPNDQGGRVGIEWNKSPYDNSLSNPQVTSYSIWRALPGSEASPSTTSSNLKTTNSAGKRIKQFNVNGVESYWEWIADLPALQLPNYGYAAPTLSDSTSPLNNGMTQFFVTAQTTDPNTFYKSVVDSGYSVDNIPPVPPTGVIASIQPGPKVNITWNPPTDLDVGSYSIYRSAVNGFTPASGSLIGTAHTISFADTNPVPGFLSYYRVIAVDVHGNKSMPSAQVSAGVTVTQVFSLQNDWNMISIPLVVSDFTKATLYPNAASNAFAYSGSYVVSLTLENGAGYWLQFSGGQNANLTGFLLVTDTITLQTGWNMIGSISNPVAVSSLLSIPGGIITSQFFYYAGSYYIADSIQPGQGYWVKVNQGGKLVLSSSAQAPASGRIRVVPTSELPPPPPGTLAQLIGVPNQFKLEQNYPNPFNPTTIITYALPVSEHVTLKVYNMLGQEVMTLVNGMQDAGYKSVSFDAGGLSSGMYVYRITSGPFSDEKKLMLVK